MMPPRLIRAAPEDSETLARLHGETFPDTPWQADWFADQLAKPMITGWLGLIDEEPAGLLLLSRIETEAEILTLGTHPRFRRRGMATALLETALSQPVETLFLEVSAANQPAIELYTAHGFVETGRRGGYYRDGSDALLLAKTISLSGIGV